MCRCRTSSTWSSACAGRPEAESCMSRYTAQDWVAQNMLLEILDPQSLAASVCNEEQCKRSGTVQHTSRLSAWVLHPLMRQCRSGASKGTVLAAGMPRWYEMVEIVVAKQGMAPRAAMMLLCSGIALTAHARCHTIQHLPWLRPLYRWRKQASMPCPPDAAANRRACQE